MISKTKKKKENLLETIKPLLILEGHWEGIGQGTYPTLKPFSYKEETSFEVVKGEPYIQMTQKAWILNKNSKEFIHWETGIISAIGLNKLKFYTCHMNGRIEVLIGDYVERSKANRIEFKSESIKNEVGLKNAIRSHRIFIFDKDLFEYRLGISTYDMQSQKDHLKAKLTKVI